MSMAVPILMLRLAVITSLVAFALVIAFIVLALIIGRSRGVSVSICNDGRGKDQGKERKYSLGMHDMRK